MSDIRAAAGRPPAPDAFRRSTDLDTALPDHPLKRDLLGHFCFYMHFAVMLYIVTGWLVPWHLLLDVYLVFIPAVFLQWQVNNDTCIMNNIEGWMRTGKWQEEQGDQSRRGSVAPDAGEERDRPDDSAWQINLLTYAVLALVWLLALAHLGGRF